MLQSLYFYGNISVRALRRRDALSAVYGVSLHRSSYDKNRSSAQNVKIHICLRRCVSGGAVQDICVILLSDDDAVSFAAFFCRNKGLFILVLIIKRARVS